MPAECIEGQTPQTGICIDGCNALIKVGKQGTKNPVDEMYANPNAYSRCLVSAVLLVLSGLEKKQNLRRAQSHLDPHCHSRQ